MKHLITFSKTGSDEGVRTGLEEERRLLMMRLVVQKRWEVLSLQSRHLQTLSLDTVLEDRKKKARKRKLLCATAPQRHGNQHHGPHRIQAHLQTPVHATTITLCCSSP